MSKKELKNEIKFGLENLEKIFQNIVYFEAQSLDDRVRVSAFTYECLGYYNAIEHLIIRILKYLKLNIPSGAFSHRNILLSFETLLSDREMSVDDALLNFLENLMAFRHVATKIYGFLLDWEKIKFIVEDIKKHHQAIKELFNHLAKTV